MSEPTVNALLYGHTKQTFLNIQNYIVKSKRFQIQYTGNALSALKFLLATHKTFFVQFSFALSSFSFF